MRHARQYQQRHSKAVLVALLCVCARPGLAKAYSRVSTAAEAHAEPEIWTRSDELEREAREYESRNNWKECGRAMSAAAESAPDHFRAPARLVEAADCLQKALLVGKALELRVKLIKTYPGNPLVRDALFKVAAAYHQLAYFTKAAACYEAFATVFPRDRRAVRARRNVEEFRKAVGRDDDVCISGTDPSQLRKQLSGDT